MIREPDYLPIGAYGVIGDLNTVALVGIHGSIDFLCFPDFDSPSLFAALLDHERGGRFRIAPVLEEADHRQLYLPESNVLLTRFLSEEGVAELSDLMPIEEDGKAERALVRRAKTVRGDVHYRMSFEPRFDYGRAAHRVWRRSDGCLVFHSDGPDGLEVALHASVELELRGGDAYAEFELRAGESAQFVLELAGGENGSPCAAPRYVQESFKSTLNYWRNWAGRSPYRGRWREQVTRSALVLKLLCSQRHGSFVAAPTFGLPETIGGVRNWDYRFTWIRDASFVLYAFSRLGHTEEASRFIRWLEERCGAFEDGGSLQVLYGIDGAGQLEETELTHLRGYRGSRPVRIGNAAHRQLQLDIYGELLDAIYLHDRAGEAVSLDLWERLCAMLAWLAENWRRPDEGIWEVRGGRAHFLYSRVLCWVAFDRGLRLAQRRSLPAPVEAWREQRDRIHADVLASFWSEDMQAFVQSPGRERLDAGALIMPLVRFIGPTDRRWRSTLRAIEERLVEDSLVHRYHIGADFPDGLEGTEGTFSLCSFWYVECLARSGDLRQARLAFEKMLGYANHLGLYAEELGPRGEHLGNFPQAFTHMGLISAAYDLDRRLDRSGEKG